MKIKKLIINQNITVIFRIRLKTHFKVKKIDFTTKHKMINI